MTKLLVIDPQRSIRNTLKERLEYEGYRVETSEDYAQGMELCRTVPFDLVLCDAALFLEAAGSAAACGSRRQIPVVVLSHDSDVDTVVRCMRAGAVDFITEPVDMNRLLAALRSALERLEGTGADGEEANGVPQAKPARRRGSKVEEIIGNSRQIVHVKRLIEKVAPSEARELITGANGTGKELVARWLHEKSNRAAGPFIEVNCAAIPSELIESELFGHEKGAFTSAIKQRKGKFEQASGGTLFMDEIGDMSLSAQAKVLRALQENRISRVGSDKDVEVNVRVVAATNKNLQEEIRRGNFREDLYHRLSVIVISVPPLVDRLEDIPLLVEYFVDKICDEYGISRKEVDPSAVEELKKMAWTGNIRELRNVIERLIILSGNSITLGDVKTYALGVI